MVPQGQLAYFTPSPGTPAPPLYQAPPFQFPQPPHTPHMPAATPASSSEPSMYGHPPHPAGNPPSAAPSGIYPSSIHPSNFTHNAGSEHEHATTAFSSGGNLPCQWQRQDIPRSSSPPPPAYPPGFEPKHDDNSATCISGNVAMGNSCFHPSQPQPQPHPHPHPHPQTHQHPHSHPHLHVNALPQPHQPPQPFSQSYPHPPSLSHPHASSQTACCTPMLLPSVQTAHLPMGQGFDANGTVIGVPVMGTPMYVDGTCAAPPPVIPQIQHPFNALHPKHGRRPMSSETRQQQSRKSTFHLTRYFRGNNLHPGNPSKEARNPEQVSWQSSISQIQRFSMEGHGTSTFRDSSQRPVTFKGDSTSSDCCLSVESNHQLQVPSRDLRFGPNRRQASNAFRENQSHSTECFHSKTCPAKEFALPKAQDVYVNGQEKLAPCQSSEHKENLQCEINRDRPDELPLRFNAGERSSLALVCSKAQISSHVKCEETACSPNASGEHVKEHQTENTSTPAESMAAPLPSVKKSEGLDRWLQEQKDKYPAPADILCKAEERREWEEMGEHDIDKPKTRLQHIKGVLTKCYHRRERPRTDNTMKYQENCIENRDIRDEEGSCKRNSLADSCLSANGSEIVQEAGPIDESPPYKEKATELEEDNQDTESQSILTSDEIVEQNNHEKSPGPGHVFLHRRKRQKRSRDRGPSGVQRQKQLLFKILDCDTEKEDSYLLQCCRFFVNNNFLQGLSTLHVKHFKWVGVEKPSSVNGSSTDEMHDSPACAMQTEIPKLGTQDISTQNIATDIQGLANGGQEHDVQVKDDCQDSNEPSFAAVDDDNVQAKDAQHASALPPQELNCSNMEQELIEDARHTPLVPSQEMSSSGKDQDLIEGEAYSNPGVQNRFVNGFYRDKEAPYPWKHLDGYFHQRSTAHGLASRHYDCFREPFCASGLILDSKLAPLLHSSSNLDAQGLAPLVWEHSNADLQVSNHEMDSGEVGSGIGDHLLNDDDDILQYMNFDAFETDSGICYV